MKTFEMKWIACPKCYHEAHIAYVEAEDENAAKEILNDALKHQGYAWISIDFVKEYEPPKVSGKVLSLG